MIVKKVFIFLMLAFQFFPFKTVYAMDTLYALTHGAQYALALGEVTEIDAGLAKINIKEIISGRALPDLISVKIPGDFLPESEPKIKPNDYVVLSINKEENEYVIAMGYYKVTGLDIKTLEILEGPLPQGDLAALQWYVNSGGVENDFYFIGTNAYVRYSDGSTTMIYPMIEANPTPTQTEKLDGTTKPVEQNPISSETIAQNQISNPFLNILITGIFMVVLFITWLFIRKKAG